MNPAISEKRSHQLSKHARILVIETNTDHWELIRKTMVDYLYHGKPVRASTGPEAMAYLTDCLTIGHGLPWLIILDVDLPQREMGWQLIDQMRSLPAPAGHLPLVVLSRCDQSEAIIESYHRGASSYIVKPLDQEQHVRIVEALIDYWWNTASRPELQY